MAVSFFTMIMGSINPDSISTVSKVFIKKWLPIAVFNFKISDEVNIIICVHLNCLIEPGNKFALTDIYCIHKEKLT